MIRFLVRVRVFG
uniref:Uncharacterized protein n=1 Tax=Anguilla anguilla TaxID=7936 RepID=A0A0E9RWU0_ANGAN